MKKGILRIAVCFMALTFALAVVPAYSIDKGKININTASLEALTELKGIGPVIAERIIEYREEHGQFETIEDLINVKGIGEKTIENIRDEITVEVIPE